MKSEPVLEKLNDLQELLLQGERPLSFKESCKFLDVSSSNLYKLVFLRKIASFKPNGKKLYFLKSDLSKFMLKHRREAVDGK